MQTSYLIEFAAMNRAKLMALGCVPVVDQKFDACERKAIELGKTELSSIMSPSMHDFTEGTCFWLFLEKEGVPIAAVATKLELLGDEPISQYWMRANRRQYGLQGEVTVSDTATNQLRGRVAYIGELFVSKGQRGRREMLNAAMHYLHAMIFLEWGVDFSYAFVRDRDVGVGLAAQYGFTRQIPSPQIWAQAPEGRSSREWLVSLPRREFVHIARQALQLS